MQTFIFDLDGTLADCSHRQNVLRHGPKNWDAFSAGCVHDKPILPTILINQVLKKSGYSIVICSGRDGSYKEQTVEWLSENAVVYDKLMMRPPQDHRDDRIIKKEMLAELLSEGRQILGVFDDRKKVVDMWIQEGIFVFDVAQGMGDF